MTIYELISLTLSTIAFLIPFFKWLYKRFFQKPKIDYLCNGRIYLYFNQSGSYARIDGVLEVEDQPVVIKKINLEITRRSDSRKLNLSWSTFISPVVQSFIGVSADASEKAHPFRIEADSVICIFSEFADEYNTAWKNITFESKELFDSIPNVMSLCHNYNDGVEMYKNNKIYNRARENVAKDFFWEIGKYDLIVNVSHTNKTDNFYFEFEINEYNKNILSRNIDETLLFTLKDAYKTKRDFHRVEVELRQKGI